jgi:N-acyl homoserine lactone hydrolase
MTLTSTGPKRLYLLQMGTAKIPIPNGTMEMVAGAAYLVQMNDGKNILIDSGLPEDYIPPAGTPLTEHRSTVIAQLALLGLVPDDIDMLICTHFDVDHVGCNDAFTKAELIAPRTQYELARSGHPRYAAARAHWDHPALHYRLIEGDTELLPGLQLIETSGHAPGHQSVLVKLPETGPVLLAIDAVTMQRLFTPDRKAWPTDDNELQLRDSTQKLLDLVESEHVALVVFGHDGEQWRTLKKAPAYYN